MDNQGNVNVNNEGTQNLSNNPPKKGFFGRVKDRLVTFGASKWGRRLKRVGTGAAIVTAGLGGYKLGKKSMKPTTIYIEHNNPEEETENQDTQEEETEEEKTEE